jgi:hypothetical protein
MSPYGWERAAVREVGQCTLPPGRPRVDRAWSHRLKLQHDDLLSNFAFSVNLRRYDEAELVGILRDQAAAADEAEPVRSCHAFHLILPDSDHTPSFSELKDVL